MMLPSSNIGATSTKLGGKTIAVATVGQDRASLEAELGMERKTRAH